MYIKLTFGNQSAIADLLNEKANEVEIVTHSSREDCKKMMFRAFCLYYLPPCGNTSKFVPPSSICRKECQMVQEKCHYPWKAALVVLDIEPVIDCNDTSKILFPIPHCCTAAGLGVALMHLNFYNM